MTSQVTCKSSPESEDLARLTGKSHGQRGISHISHSMTRPVGHFHIKEPQGYFRKNESAGVHIVRMVFCNEAWEVSAPRSWQRGCGSVLGWEQRAEFY